MSIRRPSTRETARYLYGSDMLRPVRLAYGLAPVIEVLETHGVALTPLLRAADIPRFALEEPSYRIRVDQELRFIRLAITALNIPGAGLEVGRKYTLALFGVLGLAASCAPTLRDLLRMVPTFPELSWGAIGLSVWDQGYTQFVAFHPTTEVGDLASFFVERDTAATLALFRQNAGASLVPARVRFRHPAPRNVGAYAEWFGCAVHFGEAANEIHFPVRVWDSAPPQANSLSYRFYANQCRRLSELMREPLSYADVVRARLRNETPIPTLPAVLHALRLSRRTLQRRLDAEDTTFSALLNEVRLERARELMHLGGLGQDEIARRLGFSDASAFSRAFKQWTGQSPRAARECTRLRLD